MEALHGFATTPGGFTGILLVASVLAGVIGAVLGMGGGIVIIPVLTLLFGINIHYAVGASIVSVIATSSGAAATYVRDHITNIRVAMLLEVGTTIGALTGAILASFIDTKLLFFLFAAILIYSSVTMLKGRPQDAGQHASRPDPLATRLKLNSSYPDAVLGRDVSYNVYHVGLGMTLMLGAGLLSALLGIGSGSLKVPAMDQAMKLPIKVSSATSNFMMGVTAAASAGTYFMRGLIVPQIAAPVALGVVIGSWFGTKLMLRLPSAKIRRWFVIFLLLIAAQMIYKGFTVNFG